MAMIRTAVLAGALCAGLAVPALASDAAACKGVVDRFAATLTTHADRVTKLVAELPKDSASEAGRLTFIRVASAYLDTNTATELRLRELIGESHRVCNPVDSIALVQYSFDFMRSSLATRLETSQLLAVARMKR